MPCLAQDYPIPRTDDTMTLSDALLQFARLDAATLLQHRALQRGAHPFLHWAPFDAADARTWTYAQFADEVARVGAGLRARGVQPGQRVLMHLENCPELLITYFACAHIGAICVPTNAMAAGPELTYMAELTEAVGAVTQPRFAAKLAIHCPGLAWLAVTSSDAGLPCEPGTAPAAADSFDALRVAEPAPLRAPDASQALSILFTSGTTSRPKGVLWTHANALWAARLGATQQGFRADDIVQVFLPLFHVVGLSWSVLPTLWAGATVVLQPKFSATHYWPTAMHYRSTVGSHVIFSGNVLAGQPVPSGHAFRQWCNALSLPQHEAAFGVNVQGAWGMTEMVAQGIVGDLWAPQRPGSIGRPSVGYGIRIENDRGDACRPGETGSLLVKGVPGVSIFAEYFRNPQATRDAFDEEGYFRTGDSVILHDDGSIQFSDRNKDLIKVGGEGVSAAEVERVIAGVEGVAQVAVVSRPDASMGEVAVAYVIPRSDVAVHAGLEARITETCRKDLAKFKVPRAVYFVDDFPRISVGKISKVKLREMARATVVEQREEQPVRV
jgi:crotonobetaine/carnitine-CoA ligase